MPIRLFLVSGQNNKVLFYGCFPVMTIDSIYLYFQNPPRTYLSLEQAICYTAWRLLQGSVYYSGLMSEIEAASTTYRLSDTIAFASLEYLRMSGLATSHQKKEPGRGRPRRMYKLALGANEVTQRYADLWANSSYAAAIRLPGIGME